MNILEFKKSILLCRAATFLDGVNKQYITPWVWGHAGLGKSSAVYQVCEYKKLGFIDFRASQIEAADLRGLPDKELNEEGEPIRTIFLPPSDMPVGHDADEKCPACDKSIDRAEFDESYGGFKRAQPFYCKGILFLDELPRAEQDVIQATFQLVIDGAVGTYILPPGWTMVVAGNYMEGYQQNNFQDPAWLSRFTHLTLNSGNDYKQEWYEYIFTRYKSSRITNKALQFIGFNTKHLVGDLKGDLGFTVQPTPRTWEYALRVMHAAENMPDIPRNVVKMVVSGLIGAEIANSFENFNIDIMPNEILDEGMKAIEKKVIKLSRNQLVGLVFGVAQLSKERKREKKWMENVLDFMEWIASSDSALAMDCRDMAVSLGRMLYMTENAKYNDALLSNPGIAKLLMQFNKSELSWIYRLNMREDLQDLMSKVAFGA